MKKFTYFILFSIILLSCKNKPEIIGYYKSEKHSRAIQIHNIGNSLYIDHSQLSFKEENVYSLGNKTYIYSPKTKELSVIYEDSKVLTFKKIN